MSKLALLLAESDAALAALAGVDDLSTPTVARNAASTLGRLALGFEEVGQDGASLLLDEMAALCRGAAAASGEHRYALVAAVRESFANLCATGMATRAAVESVPMVNRLRALRAASPVPLAALLPLAAPDDDLLLPDAFPQRARQWRTWFQKGLTGWLRGQPDAMELLRTVVARVAELAVGSPSHRAWRAAALFADALPTTPGAAAAVDRQRLMRIDGRLRALAERPALAFDEGDAGLTEELLGALLGLRPHALAPRGAARAALLRQLRSDLAVFRAGLVEAAGRARHTVPAVARKAADTLALLESTNARRHLLVVGDRLRVDDDVESAVSELSHVMFTLENEARLAAGEPAAGAPPVLTRELAALAEVLAETPAPALPEAPPATDAAPAGVLLATVSDIEEGRDRLESGISEARRRLLDVDDGVSMVRETVLRLEIASGGMDAEDELGTLRAQSAALVTRLGTVQEMLRTLQAPLASQVRCTRRLRRLLDDTTLESLAPRLHSHLRAAAAGAGLRVGFELCADGEPLHLPAQPLTEMLLAIVDALIERAALFAPLEAELALRLNESRRGAALFITVEMAGLGGTEADDRVAPSLTGLARRLGGRLYARVEAERTLYWLQLANAEAMRRLLRVSAAGEEAAVPVAEVVAVGRGVELPQAARVLDLASLLSGGECAATGPLLEIDVEGTTAWLRVDSAEELTTGTPLALAAPLDDVSWLAGATLGGDGRVLPVLDLQEIVLAAADERGVDARG